MRGREEAGCAVRAGLGGSSKEQFVVGSNIVAIMLPVSGAERALFIVLPPLGENDPRVLPIPRVMRLVNVAVDGMENSGRMN